MGVSSDFGLGLLFLCVLFCTVLGHDLGAARGRKWKGLFYGLFFGPLGIIVIGLMPPTARWEALRKLTVECEMEQVRESLDQEQCEHEAMCLSREAMCLARQQKSSIPQATAMTDSPMADLQEA